MSPMRHAASPRRLTARISPRWSCSVRKTSIAARRSSTAPSRSSPNRLAAPVARLTCPSATRGPASSKLARASGAHLPASSSRRYPAASARAKQTRPSCSGSSDACANAVASSAKRSAASRSYCIVLKTMAQVSADERSWRSASPEASSARERSSHPVDTRIVPNQNGASIEQISSATGGSASSAQPTASRTAASSSWMRAIIGPFVRAPNSTERASSRTQMAWARWAASSSLRAMRRFEA